MTLESDRADLGGGLEVRNDTNVAVAVELLRNDDVLGSAHLEPRQIWFFGDAGPLPRDEAAAR